MINKIIGHFCLFEGGGDLDPLKSTLDSINFEIYELIFTNQFGNLF